MPKLPDPPAPHALARIAPDPYILRAGTELWRVYARGGCHPRSWNTFRSYGPVKTMRFDHHEESVREQDRKILYGASRIPICSAEFFQVGLYVYDDEVETCGGPNARRAPATTVRPNTALPAPPIPAPMPNGTRRPSTMSPRLVPYFVTNQRPRTLLTLAMVDIGIASVSSLPQYVPGRPAAFSTKLAPLSPSRTVSSKVRRRSRSSIHTPCTLATARTNSALASKKVAI